MRKNTVVYKIIIEDIQNVAEEFLDRELNEDELKKVSNRIGEYISWEQAIENTLIEFDIKSKKEQEEEEIKDLLYKAMSKQKKVADEPQTKTS